METMNNEYEYQYLHNEDYDCGWGPKNWMVVRIQRPDPVPVSRVVTPPVFEPVDRMIMLD